MSEEKKKESAKKQPKSTIKEVKTTKKAVKTTKKAVKTINKVVKTHSVKELKVAIDTKKEVKKTNVVENSANLQLDSALTNKDIVVSNEAPILEEVKSELPSTIDEVKVKVESFDWEKAVRNDMYSNEEREDFEKEYETTLTEIIDKQVLDGTIVTITDREVVVDINFKSDGVISFNEFKYNSELKVGDTVEVLVEKQEDKNGQLVLSHRRARVLRAWEKVNVALETGEVVNGQISSRTKGGMIVDVYGIECFFARFSN
jgi:small subunit ribosomal protein S1